MCFCLDSLEEEPKKKTLEQATYRGGALGRKWQGMREAGKRQRREQGEGVFSAESAFS